MTWKLLTSWKVLYSPGWAKEALGKGNRRCARSSQLSNSRWLSAQQLGRPRSTPPPHAPGSAPKGTGRFGARLRHRVAARSRANGAGQKWPHRGPRCKPLLGAPGNVAVTAVKYCSPSRWTNYWSGRNSWPLSWATKFGRYVLHVRRT